MRGIRVSLVAASYAGVILAGGAVAVLVGVYWPRLTSTAGALLLMALAVAAGASGLAMAGGAKGLAAHRVGRTEVRHHVAGVPFAVAAVATAGAVGLLADVHAWFGASAVGLIVAMLGYALLPTVSGVVATGALSVVLAVSTVAEIAEPTPSSVGAALVAVGVLLCVLSPFGAARHRDLGVGIGAVVALVGAHQPLAEPGAIRWAAVLSLVVGLASVALYYYLPAAVLLVVAVLGVAAGALELTWDATRGAMGIAAALAATLATTGGALIGMGALGMYLWRASGEPGLRGRSEPSATSTAVTNGPADVTRKRVAVIDGTVVEDDRTPPYGLARTSRPLSHTGGHARH